jgi:hypothetical protein
MAKHNKKQIEVMEAMMTKPRISLSSKDLPEIKDWKVGETYRLSEVIMKQRSAHAGHHGVIEAEFEVESVKGNGKYKK